MTQQHYMLDLTGRGVEGRLQADGQLSSLGQEQLIPARQVEGCQKASQDPNGRLEQVDLRTGKAGCSLIQDMLGRGCRQQLHPLATSGLQRVSSDGPHWRQCLGPTWAAPHNLRVVVLVKVLESQLQDTGRTYKQVRVHSG